MLPHAVLFCRWLSVVNLLFGGIEFVAISKRVFSFVGFDINIITTFLDQIQVVGAKFHPSVLINTPYGGFSNKNLAEALGVTKGEAKRIRKQVVKEQGIKPGR